MTFNKFVSPIAREIWESKYRWRDGDVIHDQTVEDTWRRTARTLAQAEENPKQWEEKFYEALENFRFLPGGRILASAGTSHRATLFNCFVMGVIEDSMDGIFDALKEGAITMQQGGGVGYDFSTLRPKGERAKATGRIASGPVSFMRIWNTMCGTVLATGARRGAMIATLRCDHPDIFEFVRAKQRKGELNHFNLSVLVTDAFMTAVREDRDWHLVFPEESTSSCANAKKTWRRYRTIRARDLWDEIMTCTYNSSEPGVLFIDRINQRNNLWYKEKITATNPCGEIPLPPYGACDLGSVNLTQFVSRPFGPQANFNWEELGRSIPVYVRMLDNVIDVSRFPLPEQEVMARRTRRIGLGMTGLADTLAMLGLNYRSQEARDFASNVMRVICHEAYVASTELAKEKGTFLDFEPRSFLSAPFVKALPKEIRDRIEQNGIRNSHLTAIAPTGTISILANNVSSGIEPIFQLSYHRRVLQPNGEYREYDVTNYAVEMWRKLNEGAEPLGAFVTAHQVNPTEHLLMQAALQPYVDNSISKTINVSEDFSFEDFQTIYEQAYELGLKGCTTFRNNPITGSVLATNSTNSNNSPLSQK